MNRTYAALARALPPAIRVLRAPEMYANATRSFGPIRDYREDVAGDRLNLASSDRLTSAELRRRGKRLGQMAERDAAIIEQMHPDAIITDYHFTAPLLPLPPRTRVFHISHLLGYPSFYRRMMGVDFFPLDKGHILVPGSKEIEEGSGSSSASSLRQESFCGMFRWNGWQRLHRRDAAPPRSHVLLFFGSTGNGRRIVPALLRTIPNRYRVSTIAPWLTGAPARSGIHIAAGGNLERFLNKTEAVFCHGGHGTVMESILQRTPMAIFPHNIEQLEIGRRIEKLRLGILVKQPFHQLSAGELGAIIEQLRTDAVMKASLEQYSALLRRTDGAKQAVSTVLGSVADRAHN
ncbi:MAG: glycosyltransferase [Thermoanaerobaculia bacterium]